MGNDTRPPHVFFLREQLQDGLDGIERYQLVAPKGVNLPQSKVTAIPTLGGELILEYQGRRLDYTRYNELTYQKQESKSP